MPEDAVEFCRSMLKKVSRSFALTIPMLDDEIRLPIMVTYLQARLLDNFEDEIKDEDISMDKRRELMDIVVELFNPDNSFPENEAYILGTYSSLFVNKEFKELTDNALLVREVYDFLERRIQKIVHKWLKEMNRGMQKYLKLSVDTFDELDEYCYFVAGTVGGFLTDLIICKGDMEDSKQAGVLRENFNEAGLFLQKVNLIRDIRMDITGRDKNYWPLEELGIKESELLDKNHQKKAMQALDVMVDNVKFHLHALFKYYQALPDEFSGYRKFYCINNNLGLATIDKIEGNSDVFYGTKPVKVSKIELARIMKNPERYFKKRMKNIF